MDGLKKCAEFSTFLVVLLCLASENASQGIVYFIVFLSSVLLLRQIIFNILSRSPLDSEPSFTKEMTERQINGVT